MKLNYCVKHANSMHNKNKTITYILGPTHNNKRYTRRY